MYRALTAEQARAIELRAVSEAGVTLEDLMERAGTAVAKHVGELSSSGKVVVLAGPGNNGGDGWVAARLLSSWGREVLVLTVKDPGELAAEAASAARRALESGVEWVEAGSIGPESLVGAELVVDALLGTGARLPLEQPLAALCRAANESGATILAVDVPTGVDSDTGEVSPDAVQADVTVTFSAPKVGIVTYPGAGFAGEVAVAEIGIPAQFIESTNAPEIWLARDYAAAIPLPEPDAHKNSRGRVLVVAGSGRFPGAAVLAARGAMRAGAGYVTLAVPQPIVHIAQSHLLSAPVVGLPAGRGHGFSASAGDAALELAAEHDAVVLGPGLTLGDGAVATVRRIYSAVRKPLVVDADGINALVDAEEMLAARQSPTVLTPHPGELSRLLGESVSVIQHDRLGASRRLAKGDRVVLLKGAGTVVSSENRQMIVTAGTPALATAGTGDVLAGVVGTLLAQGVEPYVAGALGAYLHARAGEVAAEVLTPIGVIADDVPEYLPAVFAELLGSW